MAGLAVLASMIVVVCWGLWVFVGPGPRAANGVSTDIVLRTGDHLPIMAAKLARAGVIRSAPIFVIAAEVSGAAHRLQAGEYEFPTRATMANILAAIRAGRAATHFITIPEGMTSRAVAGILARADYLTGGVATPAEGVVLPETYDARRGEPRQAVLARMTAAQTKLLNNLWRGRAKGLPYKNPEQAVILASIVEKETAKPDERPHIAALFINRLRAGMRLESDPTVIYGLTGGVPLGHGLRVSELASDTPYNTYKIAGLPPTPIANPGKAALIAALNPAATADLYFVADGTGGHVFAATFAQHLMNVAHWRAIERARLEKDTQ